MVIRAYYADSTNCFWSVLQQVGLTPRRLAPSEFATLRESGLGLTDLAKTVSGIDAGLLPGEFNVPAFKGSIRHCRAKIIAFNGKKAARVFYGISSRVPLAYGVGPPVPEFPQIFVLPSTSGNARRWWDLKPWQKFADRVMAERCKSVG